MPSRSGIRTLKRRVISGIVPDITPPSLPAAHRGRLPSLLCGNRGAIGRGRQGNRQGMGGAAADGGLRGVITDWGGVLTNPIADTVNAWLAADLIDRAAYRTVMRAWVTQA